MSEIIELNGKKYKLIEEEKKEYKRWRNKWCVYFYICDYWEICKSIDYDYIWDSRFISNNYFQTEQEAIKERDKRLAVVRVNDAILSLNEWWEPDWGNVGEYKYFIFINSFDNTISFNYNTYYKNSYNLAYMKSEEIAQKMIKEHEEDLKLIFDIICKSL